TQGSMLDCQLETKIVSTVPGMTTCYTTRDIYSTNGRVVLLDRGSKVVGQYQGGMTQGQARIFVLWTRVETPTGVVINLDSPGAGPLGEGGLGGWVDTHFWKRFGGAIMLSMIGDVGDFLSNKASQGDSDRITFDNTSDSSQDMAATALENTINIPPTLYKNQGERLQIFVARDLDFSGVYNLERSN
ncbi:TPA: type IV secretion system protein VirB10, partial [Pseudomonas aeruginosa]|nr:type IV secretion system protein VirB10 [Pseudomonas aeruginosa]